MILFSNSRSGGGKGKQVLDALSDIIGKDRVFDLGENPHPEQILAQPEILEEARTGLRVIVCGGDGTMTWLMAAIDVVKNEVEGAKHCHYLIAPMPLGTGNVAFDAALTSGPSKSSSGTSSSSSSFRRGKKKVGQSPT